MFSEPNAGAYTESVPAGPVVPMPTRGLASSPMNVAMFVPPTAVISKFLRPVSGWSRSAVPGPVYAWRKFQGRSVPNRSALAPSPVAAMSSLESGVDVPMPTLPLPLTRILSVKAVLTP